jgi:hypothetical protein
LTDEVIETIPKDVSNCSLGQSSYMLAPYKGNYDVFRGCVFTTFICAYYENVAVSAVCLFFNEFLQC